MELSNPNDVGMSSRRLARIRPVMQRFVDEGKMPCAQTLVVRRGKPVHFETVGWQDVEAQTQLREDTIFRIYSMTKPITSVALMMLLEEGELLLTDPVANYIPAFADAQVCTGLDFVGLKLEPTREPINLWHLLTHTAGLSYGFYENSPVELSYRKENFREPSRSVAKMVDRLAEKPLMFQPGTDWQYSLATDVMGRVVEVVSGQSLAEFFQTRIFEPLEMDDTAFWVPEDQHHRFASLYEMPIGGSKIKPHETPEAHRFDKPRAHLSGGGGLVSTTADYIRFCQMLLNGGHLGRERLLSPKTVAFMTLNHLPGQIMPIQIGGAPIRGYGFGLGFRVMVDAAQSQQLGSAGEYGWSGMARTYFWIDPKEEMIGIFMTQMFGDTNVREYFRTLAYQAIID